jgi:hypothetical protein
MRSIGPAVALLAAGIIGWTSATAQLGIPGIVQLPTQDFVWTWGNARSVDDRTRPHFSISGVEQQFQCTLTGSFKLGSRMRDFYNQREFEQELSMTLEFIQLATYRLNDLYLTNQLQWATLNCVIPETLESETRTQDRVDKALEKAERQRERRRAQEER